MKHLILSMIISSLLGCASAQLTTPFSYAPVKNGKALLYIYRLDTVVGSLNPDIPKILINNKVVGPLNIGGYYKQQIEPGDIEVTWKEAINIFPRKKLNKKVEADKVYFVKLEIKEIDTFFDFVPADFGINEIKTTKLLIQ